MNKGGQNLSYQITERPPPPSPMPRLQRLIDMSCAAEVRRRAIIADAAALFACIELAATDGEHGVSKPREIVIVHYRMSDVTEAVLR